MTDSPGWSPEVTDRMFRAPLLVRERLHRATQALQDSGIHYAVIGANAVAYWVGTRDEGATRNTPNVDILIEPASLERSRQALERVSFVATGTGTRPAIFLDGPGGHERAAVRLWFTGEQLPRALEPLPTLEDSL